MQRDNKITVLESKLNGGGSQKSQAAANPASNSNVGKQREIGRKYKSDHERQRGVIDGIKKPGGQTQTENTPKSILKKPTGAAKALPVPPAKTQ